MKKMLKFAVDNQLLNSEEAKKVEMYYERSNIGDIDILLTMFENEHELYLKASKYFDLPLIERHQIKGITTKDLALEKQLYFGALIVRLIDDKDCVITFNFLGLETIPHAMANMIGKDLECLLVTRSVFEGLVENTQSIAE